jgi:hypothetical protein
MHMFQSDVKRGRFADQMIEGVRQTELECDFDAFAKVVRTRRSVRAYYPEPIPIDVMDACLDLALLAPTSHNLESWQFIDVRDPATLERLRYYCLDQAPALQAPNLIVAVGRPDFWRSGRRLMLDAIVREPDSVLPLKSEISPCAEISRPDPAHFRGRPVPHPSSFETTCDLVPWPLGAIMARGCRAIRPGAVGDQDHGTRLPDTDAGASCCRI